MGVPTKLKENKIRNNRIGQRDSHRTIVDYFKEPAYNKTSSFISSAGAN